MNDAILHGKLFGIPLVWHEVQPNTSNSTEKEDILRELVVAKRIERGQEKQKRTYDLQYRVQQNKQFLYMQHCYVKEVPGFR